MTHHALPRRSVLRFPRRATALTLSLVVSWTALAAAPRPADAVIAAPTVAFAAPGSVDALDRDSVIRGFNETWAPTLDKPVLWTGNVGTCDPGAPSGELRARFLTQINYVRDQAGVAPVSLADEPNTQAQAAALMMDANNSVNHFPPATWRCYTPTSAAGAATSLLSLNSPNPIAGLMSDDDAPWAGIDNRAVGHRRALLNGATHIMGVGATPQAAAVQVAHDMDDGRDWPRVTWPTAGYFPEGLLPPSRRWSITVREDARSLAGATAAVERVGFGQLPVTIDYASDTQLVFVPSGVTTASAVGDDVIYRVRISNVTDYNGNPVPDITYTTTLVAPDGIDASWEIKPTITGTPTAGQTTTVTPGAYTPAQDGDTVSYTWISRGEVIGHGLSVTPTMAHYGAPLSVEAKVRRTGGRTATATLVHSGSDVTYFGAPVSTGAPTLSGEQMIGSTLSVSTGSWDRPPASYEYRWFRGSSMIDGAVSVTYTTTRADADTNITARVTAYSPHGEAAHASSNSITMPPLPPPQPPAKPHVVAAPYVAGNAVSGHTLTAQPGEWWGADRFTYQWYRGGASIAGATGQHYTATNTDIGSILNITVTGHGPGGAATTWGTGSAMVRPPTAPPPPPTTGSDIMINGMPVIKGTAKVGKKLTARLPIFTPSSVTIKIAWKRNGTTIKGAKSRTYKVVAKDRRKKLTVVVTVSKSGYQTKKLTSMSVKVK